MGRICGVWYFMLSAVCIRNQGEYQMELLQVKNMSFRYAGADRQALTDLSFSIKEGEFVVIIGESGCGKTTLLRLLKRELAPHGERTGRIYYKGVEQSELDQRRAACEIGCEMCIRDSTSGLPCRHPGRTFGDTKRGKQRLYVGRPL